MKIKKMKKETTMKIAIMFKNKEYIHHKCFDNCSITVVIIIVVEYNLRMPWDNKGREYYAGT